MIISDFLVEDANGFYCRPGGFYIDPKQPVNHAVISHAHGDHAIGGNRNVHCTAATAAIMQHRIHKNAANSFFIHDYSASFTVNEVRVTFMPAGHILGSAQILMEYEGVRYLYTGDYKLQADDTCEPLEFVEADVLITESTFADPETAHPEPVAEICKLKNHQHNVLLGAYGLGKAQRLSKMITDHCPDRKVLVHHAILPLHRIYEKFGFPVGRYEPYNRKLMKEPGKGYVYIVPPVTFNNYFRAKNVMRIFASGWKRLQRQNDEELLISDHVDWNDILKMIEMVKPNEIWTVHGNGRYLQQAFSGKIPVKELSKC
ncbi:MAG TPA: MBL fold metallo-hydrolase [Sphingobacteriaceae bacterium]